VSTRRGRPDSNRIVVDELKRGKERIMQDTINQIVQGFLFGNRLEKTRALDLYQENFDLDEIQSKAVCCGLLLPNRWLEFDRDKLGILEGLFSTKRIRELTSGAEPTARERKRYRTHRLSQVRDGDIDADEIPAFWIHRIMDSNGDDLFALTTGTGYSFSFCTEFRGLFHWEKDCMDYLKMRGVVTGVQHFQPEGRPESKDQLSFLFPEFGAAASTVKEEVAKKVPAGAVAKKAPVNKVATTAETKKAANKPTRKEGG
jgi:hypothetical protein